MENQGRFIFFLVLSTVILVVYSYFFSPASTKKTPNITTTSAQNIVPSGLQTIQTANKNDKTTEDISSSIPHNVPTKIPAQQITVETDLYIAVFSNRGAVLVSYELKKYKNRQTRKLIQLVHPNPSQPKPFNIINASLPGLSDRIFEVIGTSKNLSMAGEKHQILFRTRTKDGALVEKQFNFTNDAYSLKLILNIRNSGRKQIPSSNLLIEWAPTLGQEEYTGTQSQASGTRVVTFVNGRVLTEKTKKSNESVEVPAPVAWIAIADQFFVAALIPDSASGVAGAKVARDFNAYQPAKNHQQEPMIDIKTFAPRPMVSFSVPELSRGEGCHRSVSVYFGPQEYDLLRDMNVQLERVVDFGMFGFISVYMLKLLKVFVSLFHNWGLAIVLLSILVKLLLWWPTHSSYIQMSQTQRKMRELQPQLEALKKKYANDRQRLNQETMAFYQKAGINPTAGCLPMLLQIPVFFALYSTLVHTIELRGSPFVLWIMDLQLRDPLYVLPILMGVTMIIQQKVSGQMNAGVTSGQQKFMMWFFPVFLTAISFQWPSGLLLYWVVTNLLSILQQQVVNRHLKKART